MGVGQSHVCKDKEIYAPLDSPLESKIGYKCI